MIGIAILITPVFAEGTIESHPITQEHAAVYVDSYQRAVTVPADIERVVSLGPNITEIIFALGKGDTLVGRTDYCDYPAETADIISVGTITEPNIETIIDTEPDLVIGSTHASKETLDRLEDAGITTVGIYTDESFGGVYRTITDVGMFLDAEEQAQKLVTEMQDTLSSVQEHISGAPEPTVYYVIGFGEWGDFTAGGDTFINDIIELAGGDNIAKDNTGWSYSLEQLIEQDPDIIVCSKYYGTPEAFSTTPGYKDLRAVKEGHLYPIDNNIIDRQGVRTAEGVLTLAKIFHPDRF